MSWFVILDGAGRRDAVVDSLLRVGFLCYRPRSRERVVVRGRKTWRDGFLLGRYVLVNLAMKLTAIGEVVADWAHQFHAASSLSEVAGVLATREGLPLLVRDEEVFRLRASERRGFIYVEENKFSRGQRVVISRGPMTSERAIYKFSSDKFDYVDVVGLTCANVVQLPVGSLRAA